MDIRSSVTQSRTGARKEKLSLLRQQDNVSLSCWGHTTRRGPVWQWGPFRDKHNEEWGAGVIKSWWGHISEGSSPIWPLPLDSSCTWANTCHLLLKLIWNRWPIPSGPQFLHLASERRKADGTHKFFLVPSYLRLKCILSSFLLGLWRPSSVHTYFHLCIVYIFNFLYIMMLWHLKNLSGWRQPAPPLADSQILQIAKALSWEQPCDMQTN